MSPILAAYRMVTAAVEPLAGGILRLRGEGWNLREERLGRGDPPPASTWWQAASMGEVAALEPVLNRVRKTRSRESFAVTVSTVTGRARAEELWPGRVALAPLDLPRALETAFRARRPERMIFIETELWPNWLRLAHRRGIPVAIVNGRLSDRAWPRYRRLRSLFRPLLEPVRAAAVRTDTDADRFRQLGVRGEAIRVTGNTKHDRLAAAEPAHLPWSGKRVWVAGSLRPGEEGPVLDAYRDLRSRHPDLRLVLVLRHPGAWSGLAGDLRERGLSRAVRSRPAQDDGAADVLVVDTQGELPALYAAGELAFVGGTLVPVGGHNPLEPAMSGVPVLVGPHTGNVREETRRLLDGGGAVTVVSTMHLVAVAEAWLLDEDRLRRAGDAARRAAASLRGASERSATWLRERGLFGVDHG